MMTSDSNGGADGHGVVGFWPFGKMVSQGGAWDRALTVSTGSYLQ